MAEVTRLVLQRDPERELEAGQAKALGEALGIEGQFAIDRGFGVLAVDDHQLNRLRRIVLEAGFDVVFLEGRPARLAFERPVLA